MTDLTTTDNQSVRMRDNRVPDAMGQAAMLLLESLMHGLIERKVITVADALEDLEVATDVLVEKTDEVGESKAVTERSLAMLGAIHTSLCVDLPAR